MRFKKWNIGTPAERDVALLRSAGYPYLLSTVLAARGVTTAEAAAEALERDRSLSMSPMLMRDMDKAVARIQRAISQGETIAVFGDYDVDGITSTVLLMDYLKSCGVRCLRHIPRRIEEGYGLSKEAIQGLRDQGATLMITVDCGITGQERARLQASRSQFAAFWTVLERQLRRGKAEEEMLPFLRRLSALSGGCESFLRAGLALAVFQERGLIALSVQGDQVTLSLNPIQGKVDLFACPYLSRLREDAAGKSGGVVS